MTAERTARRANLAPVPDAEPNDEPKVDPKPPKRARRRRNRLTDIAWGQPDEALARAVVESILERPRTSGSGGNLAALFGWTAVIGALLLVVAIASGTWHQRKQAPASETMSIPLEAR